MIVVVLISQKTLLTLVVKLKLLQSFAIYSTPEKKTKRIGHWHKQY